jgi:hypothetical protein
MNPRKHRNHDEELARACELREEWDKAAGLYLSAANEYAGHLTRESDKRGPAATFLRVRIGACHSRRADCLRESEQVRTAYARRALLVGEA